MNINGICIDAHSDYALYVYSEYMKGNKNILKERHLPLLRRGGVNIEILTVGGDFDFFPELNSRDPFNIIKIIELIHNEIEESLDLFTLIKKSRDFEEIKNNNKIGFLLGLEGAESIEQDLSLLNKYYKLGLRSIGITHNFKNKFAYGCGEVPAKGLTNLGKNLVEELNNLNILVDLSHISESSFWDVLELIEKPPIATHSNAKALCNHPRNLSDNQIEAMAEKKGVIGLNFFSLFIDGSANNATIDKLINHIDHMVNVAGINYIGLGPDFINYYVEDSELVAQNTPKNFGVVDNSEKNLEILRDPSELPMFFNRLLKRGYSDREIRKIKGENFMRVFKKVLKY